MLFDSDMSMEQHIAEAKRIVQLRQQQMHAAAMSRDCGEIDQMEWDGFAARYAAAVREWQVLQHHKHIMQPAMAETFRSSTWVQK